MALVSAGTGVGERELAADRPDGTESPIPVPRGWWQIESSFFSYGRDKSGGERVESWVLGETNLKYGISDRSDLQLVLAPWMREEVKTAAGTTTSEGFGDVELRYKLNLFGADEGAVAVGLLPYVKIPSGSDVSNDEWEGGLIVPLGWDLTDSVGLGLQAEISNNYDDAAGHYWAFSHTAVLGFSITEQLGAFIEYVGTASELPYEAYLSAGLTYLVNPNLQYDVAGLVGLNDHSTDLTIFSGVTLRF